jgi:CubicO group peptidase (beta-lactamase class C family)
MKKILLIILPAFAFLQCTAPKVETGKSNFKELGNYLSTEVKNGKLRGVHAMVYHEGTLVFDQFYGYRDFEALDSMRGDEQYFIQSMTKPIVSVGLMILVEEGKISLDDPVGKYLPQFSTPLVAKNPNEGIDVEKYPAKRSPTIKELLSHTSGMSHGLTATVLDGQLLQRALSSENKSLNDRLKVLSDFPFLYEPGTRWNYSFSTDLLAGVIEKVSGQPLDQFLEERIFQPLGMKNTGYNLTESQAARIQVVYDFMPDTTLVKAANQPSPSGNTLFAGVNALFSTTQDYLTFAKMLLGQGELNGVRILKPETISLMTTDFTNGLLGHPQKEEVIAKIANGIVVDKDLNFVLEPGYGFGLGFGILLDSLAAERPTATNGEFFWGGANSTYFFINPKENLIGVMMTQIGFLPNPNPYHYHYGDQFRKHIYGSINK